MEPLGVPPSAIDTTASREGERGWKLYLTRAGAAAVLRKFIWLLACQRRLYTVRWGKCNAGKKS